MNGFFGRYHAEIVVGGVLLCGLITLAIAVTG
jgi:hypothetical protein